MRETRKDARIAGDRFYFTGLSCVRGHIKKRSVASGRCVECDRIAAAEWRANNPEKRKLVIAKFEATTRKNKPEDYKEERNKKKREYWLRRRDYFRGLKRKNYENNKDEMLKKMKDWRSKNKDIIRALNSNYRGRKRGAEGRITIAVVRSLEVFQSMNCNHCANDISGGYHIDHKLPLSRGGSNLAINLQLLCPSCNLRKGQMTQEEFEEREFSNEA